MTDNSTRVIVVHGVGQQGKGDPLSDIVEPVIAYMNGRLRDPDTGAGLLYLQGTNRREDRPSSLLAWLTGPVRSWQFVEAWWADEFRQASFHSSGRWLLRVFWYSVTDYWGRVVSGNSSFLRWPLLRYLSLPFWAAILLVWGWPFDFSLRGLAAVNALLLTTLAAAILLPWFSLRGATSLRALVWALLAAPLFIAALGVLLVGYVLLTLLILLKAVPGVSRVPVVGETLAGLVEGIASALASGFGDVPAYADNPVKQVEIARPLETAILETPGLGGNSSQQRKPDHLVILAHSLGGAITMDVLRWGSVRAKLDEAALPVTVITFGAAVRKIWDLRSEETSVTGTLPKKIRWFHVYGHWDPIPNGRLKKMVVSNPSQSDFKAVTRTRIDYLHKENWPPYWKRLEVSDYAAADDGFSDNEARFVVNIGVTNKDSISEDHTKYWANQEQVVALIARLIWGPYGEPPEGRDGNPFQVTPETERDRVDMRIAKATATGILARYLLVFLPVLVFATIWLAAPKLQPIPGDVDVGGTTTFQCHSIDGSTWLIDHWPGQMNFFPCYLLQKLPDRMVEPGLNALWSGLGVLLLGGSAIASFWLLERTRRKAWAEGDQAGAVRAMSAP